jgi:transposase
MRTIGIDLAVTAAHKAVVLDGQGRYVTPVFAFRTQWEEIQRVAARAREGVAPDYPVQAVMEPTGMAWFPVAVALQRLEITPYLVNSRRAYDLRKFYKRHSSSDRIMTRVLAKMPLVDAESLYPLTLPTALQLACKRGCKQIDRLQEQITAIKNRMRDTDRFAWPGLETVFRDIFSPAARCFRQTWYNPAQVVNAGVDQVRCTFRAIAAADEDLAWVQDLVDLARQIVLLYGLNALDYPLLQQEVCREQRLLVYLEQEVKRVWQGTVQPLYHQLHPSRHVETLYGVGEASGAVYVSFIGPVARFPDNRHFRGWHGMVPDSSQSGQAESKGLSISKAGPDLLKKYAYLGADVARRYDPQIARIYYEQMVHKGNHHHQAVCACATHLLDRVRVILREDRPYELRDTDGTPVTPQQARAIIAARYTVTQEVRQRTNRHARKARAERRAEQQHQRRERKRSRPRK